jgi:hypothetical protein
VGTAPAQEQQEDEENQMFEPGSRFKRVAVSLLAAIGLAGLSPAVAGASGESAEMRFDMNPRSGAFFKEAYRPANWSVGVTISTPDPEILPMKKAALSLPPRGQMTFSPSPRMPVCPDSAVGPPPTNVSVPVDEIMRRCGRSVIGNGTATFVLGRNNVLPAARLKGYILVLNGGRFNGNPKLKVYAYSYDTNVGIYTSGVLSADGRLAFEIPPLTADSSVSELNLSIPGRTEQVDLPAQGTTITLPAGRDANYVRARCPAGAWAYSGAFDLGTRDSSGSPTGPTTTVRDAAGAPCVGLAGWPRLASVKVKGPRALPRRGARVYRVTVRNGGTARATGVRVRALGRWVAPATRWVGNIPAGQSRTTSLRVRLTRKARKGGKTAIVFRAFAKKGGAKSTTYRIRVK